MTSGSSLAAGQARQTVEDGAVHRWYRFVLAYPDHLIHEVLSSWDLDVDATVLDPFCGTGTTLVECKKLGIGSIGIDANPSSVLASQVKCHWDVQPSEVARIAESVVEQVRPLADTLMLSDRPLFAELGVVPGTVTSRLEDSLPARYLLESGMIERGWIDEIPFYVSMALLEAILGVDDVPMRNLLRLALAAIMVESVANVRFGPEIYVVDDSGSYDVLGAFTTKAANIVEDLELVRSLPKIGRARAIEGDSRFVDDVLARKGISRIDAVITSPPYPTEKDYTRNTRLELVYLGYVRDTKSLRRIKKQMVRSHSKGIYKQDEDGALVQDIPYIRAIADELRVKVREKTYGFAKMYPRIIEEYFGGMLRHLKALRRVLRPGGVAAYVVGEQRTYLQTYTPTGTILAKLAERPDVGLRVADVTTWRVRKGSTGSGDPIREEIVYLQNPDVR